MSLAGVVNGNLGITLYLGFCYRQDGCRQNHASAEGRRTLGPVPETRSVLTIGLLNIFIKGE